MPTTKLNNGQLPDTISSKTVDNTNDINTTTTRLKITGGSSGQVLSTDGSGNLSWKTDTVTDGDKGDITVSASGGTWTIDNTAVTYAKIQNVSAASRLLGRGSAAGAGAPQEITLGTNLSMSGTTLNATSGGVTDGDKGDITVSASGATWTIDANAVTATKIASDAVTTAKIQNDAVTYAKIQNVTTNSLLGRVTAGSGDTEEITIGSGLSVSGTTLSVSGVPTAVVSKAADETVTSSTTFQADDHLTYTLTANRMYYIEFVLIVKRANTAASPIIKFAVDAGSYGSGDFIQRLTARLWDGTTSLDGVLSLDATYNYAGRVFINGMVIPSVNQAVTLYFAQSTSSTTGVTVRKNSIMRIYDLGAV